MNPAIVILAGGEGRRLGGNKPLRLLEGRSLLERAIEWAKPRSDNIFIAARSADQVGETGLPILLDPPNLAGPLGGLASALCLEVPAVLTIPCDAPFLPEDLAERLQGAIGDRLAALAASGGDLHPTCALWRTEALCHLPAYVRSGRGSLTGFAEAIGFAPVEWEARCFANVNSPKDFAEAARRLASEGERLDRASGGDGSVPGP